MNIEIEKEIQEGLFIDRFFGYWHKYKKYIIFFSIVIFLIPISYQVKIHLEKKRNIQDLETYSLGLIELNQGNINKAKNIFNKLVISENSIVAMLAINQLLEINTNLKIDALGSIDKVINQKTFPDNLNEVLNIKKSLIIFDKASEDQMLKLLVTKKNYYQNIKSEIMYDFYTSKGQQKKAQEFKLLINEK